MKLDVAAQELLILVIIFIFILLLVDLAASTLVVCKGCEAQPLINLLPSLR